MSDISSIDEVQAMLAGQGYVCGRALGTVVFLSLTLGRPLFENKVGEVGGAEGREALQP